MGFPRCNFCGMERKRQLDDMRPWCGFCWWQVFANLWCRIGFLFRLDPR